MKILHFSWKSYLEYDIYSIYRELSIEYVTFSWSFTDKNNDEEFVNFFLSTYNTHDYYCVFSINYWPLLSSVCQTLNIPYISWCYDAPLDVRNIELTLGNEVNRVYLFDRMQYEAYKKEGFNTVFHLPLGVNSTRLSKVHPRNPQCTHYKSDISFVGQLYSTPLNEIMSLCSDYVKGYLSSIINIQQNVYGEYLIDKVLTDNILKMINRDLSSYSKLFQNISQKELSFTIAAEITRRDRLLLLSFCGLHYNTTIYSYDKSELLSRVKQCPPVDYIYQMPYVFSASKINLSPSLRAIQTGIPLRALDVMACDGFLISNYQEEFLDYFEPDYDIVLYESIEDAIDKIRFYMANDFVRDKITRRGRMKTLSLFNMKDRITLMLTHPPH